MYLDNCLITEIILFNTLLSLQPVIDELMVLLKLNIVVQGVQLDQEHR